MVEEEPEDVGDEASGEVAQHPDAQLPWLAFLERLGLKESKHNSERYEFCTLSGSPVGYIHYMGASLNNLKASCTQHKGSCGCWIHARGTEVDETQLFRDIVAWLGQTSSDIDGHKLSAYNLKVKYGMKPKKLA